MEESWLNPDIAINNIVTLVSAILVILIVVPVVFAALLYGVLSMIARLQAMQRPARSEPDSEASD